ncbi:hypothetical protein GPALN_004593 [Globodera pallida]|nr:hypothetical protein GPALN_004593 [Globodera pallida]
MENTVISLFILLLFCILNIGEAKELKVSVKYEKTAKMRQLKINLHSIHINNEIADKNIHQNIKSDENFEIFISDNVAVEEIHLLFDIYVNPLQNEYQPDDHDENPSDDQPFDDKHFAYKMDDIRAMVRTIKVVLYVPNFSKRYTINLGKIDPPELFWNRRVFVETKNAAGNFHAFLYATLIKNRRNLNYSFNEDIFLGYAPLTKIEGESSKNNHQKFTEYQLSIPINGNQLFKSKLLSLTLSIFTYKEDTNLNESNDQNNNLPEQNDNSTNGNNSNEKINENSLSSAEITADNDERNDCSICLETLNSEKLTMKLHESHNQNSQHIFHKDCIIKWIGAQGKIRCPLCNKETTFITSTTFGAIFNEPTQMSSFMSINPIAKLVQIANGEAENDDDDFKQIQAKSAIKKITAFVNSSKETVRVMLSKIDFLNFDGIKDEKLFEIGAEGFEESPNLQRIQLELEQVRNNRQNLFDHNIVLSMMTLQRIKTTKNEANSIAIGCLENMQIISEEKI